MVDDPDISDELRESLQEELDHQKYLRDLQQKGLPLLLTSLLRPPTLTLAHGSSIDHMRDKEISRCRHVVLFPPRAP